MGASLSALLSQRTTSSGSACATRALAYPLDFNCAPQGGPGGFLFSKRVERWTAPSVIRVCGLRPPSLPPTGFAAKPPPLQDGGFLS
jgi:hypothetical protein